MIIFKIENFIHRSLQDDLLILLYEIPPGGQEKVHQDVVVISV